MEAPDPGSEEADELARRLLAPLRREEAAPPPDLLSRVLRRIRGWTLLREAIEFTTTAPLRFLQGMLGGRSPGRAGERRAKDSCERER